MKNRVLIHKPISAPDLSGINCFSYYLRIRNDVFHLGYIIDISYYCWVESRIPEVNESELVTNFTL